MAKSVVFGIEGEEGLWVADLDAGTVVPMEADTSGSLKTVEATRKAGAVTTKGIDFAIFVANAGEGASGSFEGASGSFEAASGLFES